MAELATLLGDLGAAIDQRDADGMRRLRQQVIDAFPDSEAAAEAHYRLGLDALFMGRDIDRAMASFELACQSKHPSWAPAARTSLALCYLHLGRQQKGLFELRKVAFAKESTAHSVTALTLLESFCAGQSQADEVQRVRKERISQLERILTNQSLPPSTRGQYLVQLGLACQQAGDRRRASEVLGEARALGPAVLGTDEHALVTAALG